jgi:DNA repair exonuclease SbcCD ATPase subunit
MFSYLKAAFLISPEVPGLGKMPVNVLACAAVAVLGIALHPLWLIGLGLETAFLFTLATNPRFRKYVDALRAHEARAAAGGGSAATLERILRELPAPAIRRYDALRRHCVELQHIAAQLRHGEPSAITGPFEEMQRSGLDRLLWIYLRLLFTQHMLDRVFQSSSEEEISRSVRGLEEQLRRLGGEAADQKSKLRRTLEDNLQTCRERLANYQTARERVELVRLELDRLENKIRSLGEMAVSRQEPNFIADQMDQVAAGMVQTERTIQELQFATGLESAEEDVPPLLQREAVPAGR